MAGLTPEHHSLLNGAFESQEKEIVLKRLRHDYRDDPLALEDIDRYDLDSPYMQHLEVYLDAVRKEDKDTAAKEKEWFHENYPLTHPKKTSA